MYLVDRPVDGQYGIKSHLDSQNLRVLGNQFVHRKSAALKPSMTVAHEYSVISRKRFLRSLDYWGGGGGAVTPA